MASKIPRITICLDPDLMEWLTAISAESAKLGITVSISGLIRQCVRDRRLLTDGKTPSSSSVFVLLENKE